MGMMTRRNVKRRAVKKTAPAKIENKPLVKEIVVEQKSDLPYTKTEVNRMSTADLKLVALNAGVEDADDLSGAELKKILIKKFGL